MSITRTGAEFVHAGPLPGQRTLAVGRGPRQPATLVLLAFAMLVVSLDQYIVVVALPEIGRDLGYSAHTLQSVISAYAVASAGFLLLGGRAADLLGGRRVFVSGLALYAGGSLAGGFAPGPEFLLVARSKSGQVAAHEPSSAHRHDAANETCLKSQQPRNQGALANS